MASINKLRALMSLSAVIAVSACTLPLGGGDARLAKLDYNRNFQVHPMDVASSAHEPNGLRNMYFVLRQEAPPSVGGSRSSLQGPLAVRTTAYTHSESDHLAYGRLTAIGSRLKYGPIRSAAADWSRFPLGTRFRIKGQPTVLYEVDDYGSALVGTNTIDLYCPTKRVMHNWGVRNVDIDVVQWGSFTRSAAVMQERIHFSHVRRMLNDINLRNLVQLEAQPSQNGRQNPRLSPLRPAQRYTPPLGPLRDPYVAMF